MEDANTEIMNRRRALGLGGAVVGGLIATPSAVVASRIADAAEAAAPDRLILDGVTIVETHDGKLMPNMMILIDDGKIIKIAAAGSIAANGAARAIDARGKYVVPGYNDFHSHPLSSSDPEGSLTLMLANGITGFREMATWGAMLDRRRQGALMPAIEAPELLEMAGEILTSANAGTPAVAVAEVQRQKAAGADFIKVIDYSPDVFFAVAGECKRLGLRFIGHLSPTVNVRDAATAGMRSIEHMGPRDSVLLGCSTEEMALRPAFVPIPANPIASVRNLRRIAAVVRSGKYHSADALSVMKQKQADRVANGTVALAPGRPSCC